jgi:GNAT superfamily N-acetyltransferase
VAYVDEHPIGVAILGREGDFGLNTFTGVDRSRRGQGVPRALKIAVAQRARELGVKRLTTLNNACNEPMLKVNDRLGYERQPGLLVLRRPI